MSRRGFRRYAEYQSECTKANPHNPSPQAPLKGELPPQRLRGAASSYLFAKAWANSYNPLLPPLGEVPRSGKGGGVGIFELSPFNGPHPLSQAVRPASSPTGEPSGLLRIRLGYHEAIGACRETPLRRAKSRLAAAQLCIKRLYAVEDGYTR